MFGKKVRRPTGLECTAAATSALMQAMSPEAKLDHQMYGQMIEFFQGPLRTLFLQGLQNIAGRNGYYLDEDQTHGLLFKKM